MGAPTTGTKLPEGMYKYAVKTDGVKGPSPRFVQAGDHVDVHADRRSTPNGKKVKAGIIFRDMLVLAVGIRQGHVLGPKPASAREDTGKVGVAGRHLPSNRFDHLVRGRTAAGDVKLVLRDVKNQHQGNKKTTSSQITTIPGFDVKDKRLGQRALPIAPQP